LQHKEQIWVAEFWRKSCDLDHENFHQGQGSHILPESQRVFEVPHISFSNFDLKLVGIFDAVPTEKYLTREAGYEHRDRFLS
jgi:hypothetical protein